MAVVLDASAIIAVLRGEPVTGELLASIDEGALVSAVNAAEVSTWFVRNGDADLARSFVDATHVAVVPLLEDQAIRAGELEAMGGPLNLSLADRCCLATAEAFDARVLTTDRAWLELPSPWRERVVCVRGD